jgi:GT2 family glycosyltransferase
LSVAAGERELWASADGSPFWWWLPSVSVIMCAHNEGANVRRTVHNLLATLPANSEIIAVDDVSTDGCLDFALDGYPGVRVVRTETRLGVAGSRNLGAAYARGHMLVFSDAHVEVEHGWVDPFVRVLAEGDVGVVGPSVSDVYDREASGCGMTVRDADTLELEWLDYELGGAPRPVPALCGMFTAMRREVFVATGGFDPGLEQWGDEDLELCLRLWLIGYRCLAVPEVRVAHLFREAFPYELDGIAPLANRIRVGLLHLEGERLQRFLARLASRPGFQRAFERACTRDAAGAAERLRSIRRHDADWFFECVAGIPAAAA